MAGAGDADRRPGRSEAETPVRARGGFDAGGKESGDGVAIAVKEASGRGPGVANRLSRRTKDGSKVRSGRRSGSGGSRIVGLPGESVGSGEGYRGGDG